MAGLRRISYLWKEADAARNYSTAVSLHSHTNQSKETLDFLANLGNQYPRLRPILARSDNPEELGRVAHFRVLECLGAGGMGVVYRANDTKLQRIVALKLLRPSIASDPTARARFLREARAVASIKQEHVVVISYRMWQQQLGGRSSVLGEKLLLDVGISSSFHIAKFWGLTGQARSKSVVDRLQIFNTHERPEKRIAEPAASGAPVVDIKATITQALRAAGLMKAE